LFRSETGRYVRLRWADLRVGDIVHLSNNETVPADILLLKSSEPQGICYIETCDLDGETSLKRRQVVQGFNDKQSNFQPSKFLSKLEIDSPTTKIYRFHGTMIHPKDSSRVPISTDNLLLRESRLKVSFK
jgi:phospholipid-translocating ATPase